ncbi:hypothetical protein [Paenibacillus glufosinatiresistens]|uniref:hypothetical protein n=1 Tax=Paenibacillus glufosinatiresistens TaxID=3070657 RepID=UPI00286E7CF7|nr:hypothetical protein [Paenibacillus sp. YX.27]
MYWAVDAYTAGALTSYVNTNDEPWSAEHFLYAANLAINFIPISAAEAATLKVGQTAEKAGVSLIQKAGQWIKILVKGEVGNKSVISVMSSNAAKYESNLAYDCSEIAQDLAKAAGNKGEILTIKSSDKYGSINITEYGRIQSFDYHTVFSDGKYIYDPRFSNQPIPVNEYMNSINKLNNGNVSISVERLK